MLNVTNKMAAQHMMVDLILTCLVWPQDGPGNCKTENAFINKLIIIAKLCVSKFKYGNHPNLILLFLQELRLRNVYIR